MKKKRKRGIRAKELKDKRHYTEFKSLKHLANCIYRWDDTFGKIKGNIPHHSIAVRPGKQYCLIAFKPSGYMYCPWIPEFHRVYSAMNIFEVPSYVYKYYKMKEFLED